MPPTVRCPACGALLEVPITMNLRIADDREALVDIDADTHNVIAHITEAHSQLTTDRNNP